MIQRIGVLTALTTILTLHSIALGQQAFTNGNVLLTCRGSFNHYLLEYTRKGDLVQRIEIVKPEGVDQLLDVADVESDSNARAYLLIHTRTGRGPGRRNYLCIYDSVAGTWLYKTAEGMIYGLGNGDVDLTDNAILVNENAKSAFIFDLASDKTRPDHPGLVRAL